MLIAKAINFRVVYNFDVTNNGFRLQAQSIKDFNLNKQMVSDPIAKD